MLCSQTTIDLTEPTIVHTFLHGEVEHCFVFAIINTRDTAQVALAVVCLNPVDDIGWEILEGDVLVVDKEFFTIHEHLLHFLTIDFDGTIIVNRSTWKLLYEVLQHTTFMHAVCISIVDE